MAFSVVTVSVEVSLDTTWTKLRRSVGMHIFLTLLHFCAFVSLTTQLLCVIEHSSNAFALTQVASHETDFHLTRVFA